MSLTLETTNNLTENVANILCGSAWSTHAGWNAFDGDDTTFWGTVNGAGDCYIGWKLDAAKALVKLEFINSYRLHTQYFATDGVGEWSDNNGSTWTQFASWSGKTTPGELISLDASSAGSHQCWRARGTSLNQFGCWFVAEFALYSGSVYVAPAPATVCCAAAAAFAASVGGY